jgi:hypothetical protein
MFFLAAHLSKARRYSLRQEGDKCFGQYLTIAYFAIVRAWAHRARQ